MRTAGIVLVIAGIVGVVAPVLYDCLFKREPFIHGPQSVPCIVLGVVAFIVGMVLMRKGRHAA